MKNFNSYDLNPYDFHNNNKYKTILYLKRATSLFFVLLVTIFYAFASFSFILERHYPAADVVGGSMLPTLNSSGGQDTVYINDDVDEYGYLDIIIVNTSENPGDEFDSSTDSYVIKRVIAKDGDTLEMKDTNNDGFYNYYRNDKKLEEDYINTYQHMDSEYYLKFSNLADSGVFTVPEDEYFYLGDNRGNSSDSLTNSYTTVGQDRIVGRVDIIIRPDRSLLLELARSIWMHLKY